MDYTRYKIEPWDYIISNNLDYWQGNILKYITRWQDKGGIEDLIKARHFLDKYIELKTPVNTNIQEEWSRKEKIWLHQLSQQDSHQQHLKF